MEPLLISSAFLTIPTLFWGRTTKYVAPWVEMKASIVELLACPACLPDERPLTIEPMERSGDEVFRGTLKCCHCLTSYSIENGIAELIAPSCYQHRPQTMSKYEEPNVLSSYLWSHYADLLGDEDACFAYRDWADQFSFIGGVSLDSGCAVGRLTFEMAQKSDLSIGFDRSRSFIESARILLTSGRIDFSIPIEGHIHENLSLDFPESWDRSRVEFLVADVHALPFRFGFFARSASLNILDKIEKPLVHLAELNRVSKLSGAEILISDPFSWSSETCLEENWLGGLEDGPYRGRAIDNMVKLMQGESDILVPPWRVEKVGSVWWKIRNHSNHFELIRSCYIKAAR